MNQIIELPISPKYVLHWGVWEAIREILQNALDEKDTSGSEMTIVESENRIEIGTVSRKLEISSLLLGETSKDGSLRGKFGEGYKLALLVLCRLGFKVKIWNWNQVWWPSIGHSEVFKCDVLKVEIVEDDSDVTLGVRFSIEGPLDASLVSKNTRLADSIDMILSEEDQKGRVYSGGLFVCCMEGFHCGYSFKKLPLDRDRGLVNSFDLAFKTSELWSKEPGDEVIRLINLKAPDVEYLSSFLTSSTPVFTGIVNYYDSRHGSLVVPVENQEEIQTCISSGRRWALVPSVIKKVLMAIRDYFVPSGGSVLVRLERLLERIKFRLEDGDLAELKDIVEVVRNGESKS